jgi:hypothetical protein
MRDEVVRGSASASPVAIPLAPTGSDDDGKDQQVQAIGQVMFKQEPHD